MKKDVLFLLAPGFEAKGRREFCPECAEIWGVLAYFPAIREALDIRYEPLAHPRPGLVKRLGEGNWNCPTLVLADGADAGPHAAVKTANGVHFLDNSRDIARYFAHRFGTPFPRGS
ncbi:DUF3088 family protein [Hyphococcus luteus]|uniref:DUF3088 domain-containing protein n=1 Tax=Hyphococcus luteus TaxID=2058213 RepID=A0A2S7K6T2_9PROT|nr:DUF3088 family protein [Marinicaulis flavus]PQA88225.1 hypothetical protein CW354_07935 [Marinicaulis flavus]